MTLCFQTLLHAASAFYQNPVFPASLPRDPVPTSSPRRSSASVLIFTPCLVSLLCDWRYPLLLLCLLPFSSPISKILHNQVESESWPNNQKSRIPQTFPVGIKTLAHEMTDMPAFYSCLKKPTLSTSLLAPKTVLQGKCYRLLKKAFALCPRIFCISPNPFNACFVLVPRWIGPDQMVTPANGCENLYCVLLSLYLYTENVGRRCKLPTRGKASWRRRRLR